MREYTLDSKEEIGTCVLIYGEPAAGKTGALITLPDPLCIISVEPRDPRRTLNSVASAMDIDIKKKKITILEPDSFDEALEYLNTLDEEYRAGEGKFKSIAFDSLTFEQSKFRQDLEDSRYEKETNLVKDTKKSRYKTLVDRFRLEYNDWSGLGSMMMRLTYVLNRISRYGVYTVATATLMQYPKWDRELSAAPAFKGSEYGSVFSGYFDFIGLVRKQEGKEPYPPIVSFVSDGDFMAKSCSHTLNKKGGKGVLDFGKILKVIESEN